MALDTELDIAQQKRGALVGRLPVGEAPAKKEAAGESMIERTSRHRGYEKTMGPARKLQDQYREKHGLDEFNRPVKKTSSRGASRR